MKGTESAAIMAIMPQQFVFPWMAVLAGCLGTMSNSLRTVWNCKRAAAVTVLVKLAVGDWD